MIRRKKSAIISRMLSNISEQNKSQIHNKIMIAAKIADAIKAKGMTQKEFAIKMQKSESDISEWLSGDRNFTIDTLSEIEVALGIKLLDTQSNNYTTVNTYMVVVTAPAKKSISVHNSAMYQTIKG